MIAGDGMGTVATSIAGSAIMAAAPFTGPAAPLVAVAGFVTSFVGSLFKPDQKKIATTQIVDQAEKLLKQNLDAWKEVVASGQADEVSKEAAEANFNAVWTQVQTACSNPAYGSAGANCTGDRQRGGKWDWFKLYYDPIANYQVAASNVGGSIASLFGIGEGSGGGGGVGLLLGVGVIGLILVLGD